METNRGSGRLVTGPRFVPGAGFETSAKDDAEKTAVAAMSNTTATALEKLFIAAPARFLELLLTEGPAASFTLPPWG